MTSGARVQIAGVGYAVPDRVVTNAELASRFNTSDEWIREKIGIRERRFVSPGEGTSDLAVRAAREALKKAHWQPHDVEAIVIATSTPDYAVPGAGVLVQDKLGCRPIPAFDIHNSSPGFLFAMETATALLESCRYRKLLVIGAEVHSTGLDFSDRGRMMSVIFGDGAGAFALERMDAAPSSSRRLSSIPTLLYSDGKYFDKLWCEAPASLYHPRLTREMIAAGRIYPTMDGPFIFKEAVAKMSAACEALLEANRICVDDLDWVVPHQANLRIIEALGEKLHVPREKIVTTIDRFGNLSAASIPVAFACAEEDGRLKRGDLVLCPSFGSGLSWGAMLIEIY